MFKKKKSWRYKYELVMAIVEAWEEHCKSQLERERAIEKSWGVESGFTTRYEGEVDAYHSVYVEMKHLYEEE